MRIPGTPGTSVEENILFGVDSAGRAAASPAAIAAVIAAVVVAFIAAIAAVTAAEFAFPAAIVAFTATIATVAAAFAVAFLAAFAFLVAIVAVFTAAIATFTFVCVRNFLHHVLDRKRIVDGAKRIYKSMKLPLRKSFRNVVCKARTDEYDS